MQEVLPPDGGRENEKFQSMYEAAPAAAEDERHDGDQSRYAQYYFGRDLDFPATKGEREDVVGESSRRSRTRRSVAHN